MSSNQVNLLANSAGKVAARDTEGYRDPVFASEQILYEGTDIAKRESYYAISDADNPEEFGKLRIGAYDKPVKANNGSTVKQHNTSLQLRVPQVVLDDSAVVIFEGEATFTVAITSFGGVLPSNTEETLLLIRRLANLFWLSPADGKYPAELTQYLKAGITAMSEVDENFTADNVLVANMFTTKTLA
jgi:hypothetical protein